MKFDFTNGKWCVDKIGESEYIFDDAANIICDLSYDSRIKRRQANARLISCAPKMLMALIEIRKKIQSIDDQALDCLCHLKFDIDTIDNIIKKATGKKWSEIEKGD